MDTEMGQMDRDRGACGMNKGQIEKKNEVRGDI